MDGVAGKEKLTVNDDGDDNDVCGLVELPCSSLDFGFEHLKKEEKTLETNGSADLRLDFFGSEPRPTRPGRMFGPVTDAAAGGQEGEKGGGKLHVDALPPPILRHVVLRDHHQAADTVVLEGTQIDRSAGKEFKSKFDLPFVFKSPTNSHKAQSASESLTLGRDCSDQSNSKPAIATVQSAPVTPNEHRPPAHSCHSATIHRRTKHTSAGRQPPEEISGDMRLAFVQHPATRFESDDSDPEPPPPPENEEWESDVLLPSPPQTMPTLTQRRRRMFLVSVQIITHSLSLLIPPVCDDFMQLLNLGTNRESPNEKASEERIVDPTQIPNPSTLSVALDSTQQFTFDMSTAGTRYNNIIQSYAESTANGNNADYRRTQPSSELNLERRHQRGRSKSSEDEDVVGVEGAGLPRKRHEADARPVVDVDHPNTVALAFEAMRALHVNSIPEIPRAFKTQLVKNSGNFYAWHVGQDETAKTKFPIRKGKLQLEADRLGTHAQLC
ncbi:hypothetical protein BLNAU_24551 [Blattamonas nauphoetae]|uniref:Uncharacterized protein n=1 Tax=Blattamonas nauphoetae TaxID=2049346 RepID=A0ABQ9WM37_9EUKA|nr:hypothetical protein BLNAU_24551 [Blattamonas nauphoetae]